MIILISLISFIGLLGITLFDRGLSNNSRNKEWAALIEATQKKDNAEMCSKNKEIPFIISRLPIIAPSSYVLYKFHNYSVRSLSYPGESTRYYAVVTISGGSLNKTKANAIIHFNGENKDCIYNYGLISNNCFKKKDEIWTFEEVKRRLDWEIITNTHIYAYYKNDAYYFETVEDAIFALTAFKQVVDQVVNEGENHRVKNIFETNVSEDIINVKFV